MWKEFKTSVWLPSWTRWPSPILSVWSEFFHPINYFQIRQLIPMTCTNWRCKVTLPQRTVWTRCYEGFDFFYCLHRFTRGGHVNPYPPLPANVCTWDSWSVGKQSWVEKNTSEMVPWQRKGNQGERIKYYKALSDYLGNSQRVYY